MMNQPHPWVAIGSGELSAEIDPRGAQLSALRDSKGRDLLWDGDPAVWSGRAPLLFPIVGTLTGGQYRLGSRTYALPRHGFARGREFSVVTTSLSAATFRLTDDAASRLVYPFGFELEVQFDIAGSGLGISVRVRNPGDVGLAASFGFHPAFRWPLPFGQPRSAHYLEFELDEPAPVRRLDAAGLLTPERHPTPVLQRRLTLTDELFAADVLILDRPKSRSVLFGAASGPRLQVKFPDAPYLGLWSKPQAPFVCIEPWHGVADPVGFSGDFTAKPGVFIVEPGATLTTRMSVTVL